MKRIIYILIIFLSFSTFAKAQEQPVFSQYLENFYYLNPAAVGWKPCTEILLTDRHQWVGVNGAPQTQALGVYSRLSAFGEERKGTYQGVGLNYYNDKNGPTSTQRAYLSFAHHFTAFQKGRNVYTLSMSLAASGFQHKLDETQLTTTSDNDPLHTGSINSQNFLNFDASILLYSRYFAAGITAAQIQPTKINYYQTPYEIDNYYMGFLSYRFVNDQGAGIEPSMVVKTTLNTTQIDINSKFYFNKTLYSGLSYRHNLDVLPGQSLAIQALLGVKYRIYTFAYAFDTTIGKIGRNNLASHNFMIGIRFCKSKGRNCPAYQQNPMYRQ